MWALSQAGGELLGPDGCELVVLDAGERNPSWGLAFRLIQPQIKATTTLDNQTSAQSFHDARGRPWSPQALGRCHPLPRFPYSLQHPQGYHVWKHVCQALGSHVADAVIVQAAGNRSQGRGWGAGVQGPGGSTPSRDYCPSLQRVS